MTDRPDLDHRRNGLIASLERFVDDPEVRDRMLALATTNRHPCSRSLFVPGHFTASGFVLSPDRRSVLLIEHRRLRRWLQPGGHIDPSDRSPEAAARREVAEETGVADLTLLVDGLFDLDIHPIPPRSNEPEHEHFDLRYAFVAASGDLRVDPEVADARWVPFGELDPYDLDRSTRRAIGRLASFGA